jgi:hypothetical protein
MSVYSSKAPEPGRTGAAAVRPRHGVRVNITFESHDQ